MAREMMLNVNGQEVGIVVFDTPMSHEDWHEADRLGVVYCYYLHHGPDYWDDELVFSKPEFKEMLIKDHLEQW
jgi:hypothetical protein